MNSLLSQRKTIDLYLLVGLIAIAVSITVLYISQEQYFYFWDYIHYSDRVSQLAAKLHESPLKALENFVDYLGDDYTQIPSLLLLPFSLLFENSRLAFVLSLVLVYLVPFCLIMGMCATHIFHAQTKPKFIFWITAYLTLFIPSTWVSILRGYPDLGGASIITLAILYYWQNSQLDQRRQIIRLAGLLAIAVWFRRPFIYSVRAFFVTLFIEVFLNYLSIRQISSKRAFQELKQKTIQIVKVGIWFIIFSPVLVFKVLFVDYRTLYASYELSVYEGFQYYTNEFGWLIIILACVGYAVGFIFWKNKYQEFRFFFILGSLSIIQWIFLAKQNASHYATHFLSFFIVGCIFLGFCVKTTLDTKPRIFSSLFVVASCLIVLNTISGLTILGKQTYPFRAFFAAANPPLFRTDYDEVGQIVSFLRTKALEHQFIYVAASSQTLTSDALVAAERQIYQKSQLKVLRTSNIDSRDVYPLNALMKAHFVIVASPVQYHLKPDEQKVVRVVVDTFKEQEFFSKDFKLLPIEFFLENGVQVKIYERLRETSFLVVRTTLRQMREKIDRQPGREPYWLSLESEQPTNIEKDIVRTVQLRDIPLQQDQLLSFLYFGSISPSLALKAKLNTRRCQNPGDITLTLSALDPQGKALTSHTWLNNQSDDIKIHFRALPQPTSYLRLDIQRSNPLSSKQVQNQCSVEVNNIAISG
jgi:hypothetical protein